MRPLIYDLEFVGDPRKGGRILCCGWQWGLDGKVQCVDHIPDEVRDAVADPDITTVCHSKADWRWFREAGLEVAGPLHDTMVMAWVINENTPLSLEWCAKRYANIVMDKRIRQVKGEPIFRCDDGTEVPLALLGEECPLHGKETTTTEATSDIPGQSVSRDMVSRTPEQQRRSGVGAQMGSGAEVGSLPSTGRGRAPRQRESEGQPTGESLCAAEGSPQTDTRCLCELRQQLMRYNREDVAAEAKVYAALMQKMTDTAWDIYFEEEQVPFTSVLLDMEMNGIPINLDKVEALRQELEPRLEQQEEKLAEVLGYRINFGSGDQLRSVLFSKVWYEKDSLPHGLDVKKPSLITRIQEAAKPAKLTKVSITNEMVDEAKMELVKAVTPVGFTVQKVTPKNLVGYWTRKGYGLPETPPTEKSVENGNPKPTTAMSTLLATFPDHPFVVELAQWSKIRKVITTYLRNYPKFTHEGYLYGTFSQTGTKTGRISSARPNLMNQPAHGELGQKVRELFEGRLIVGDYGQLEPRLMADFSQDPVLLQAYTEGIDVYALTAAGIFGGSYKDYPDTTKERKLSKQLFLGDQYGAGHKKLTMLLRLNGFAVTVDEVKRFQAKLHATYGVLMAWKEDVIRGAHRRGFVETLDGHRRRLAVSLKDRSWKNRGYGERQAVNAVVQGSAGDVVRRCMVTAADTFPQLRMLAQVHDEVLWEPDSGLTQTNVEDLLPILRTVMQEGHGFKLEVPLVFEPSICRTWADKGLSDIEWLEDEEEDELR